MKFRLVFDRITVAVLDNTPIDRMYYILQAREKDGDKWVTCPIVNMQDLDEDDRAELLTDLAAAIRGRNH